MDNTKRSDVGITFWLVSEIQDKEEYTRLIHRMSQEGYAISSGDVFLICDERSKNNIPKENISRIPLGLILTEDSAIGSIISSIGGHILMIEGSGEAYHPYVKRMLSVLVSRLMGSSFCTMINGDIDVHVIDVISTSVPEEIRKRMSPELIKAMKGIQYNGGNPILTLYRLSSYIISHFNWLKLTIASCSRLKDLMPGSSPSRIDESESYLLLNVRNMNGYNFDTEDLFSILDKMGKRSQRLSSILISN